MESERINIQCPVFLKDELRIFCIAKETNITSVIIDLIIEKLNIEFKGKEKKELFKHYKGLLERKKLVAQRKVENRQYFFFWQTITRIKEFCIEASYHELPFPMRVIRKNIKLIETYYDTFTDEEKKKYISVYNFIKGFDDQQNIMTAFKNKQSLMWKEKKK